MSPYSSSFVVRSWCFLILIHFCKCRYICQEICNIFWAIAIFVMIFIIRNVIIWRCWIPRLSLWRFYVCTVRDVIKICNLESIFFASWCRIVFRNIRPWVVKDSSSELPLSSVHCTSINVCSTPCSSHHVVPNGRSIWDKTSKVEYTEYSWW